MDGDNLTEEVILLIDAFTEYFYPEIGEAAIRVLRRASCKIHLLPVIGAGRTMISKGFLVKAKRHAKQVVNAIYAIDPDGRIPIVGIEPSEIYTLQDEYQDLLPEDDRVASFIQRTFTIEEYLIRPASSHHPPDGMLRIDKLRIAINSKTPKPNVYLHNHCYQKTLPPASDGYPNGGQATAELLKKCGYKVEVIDAGCCGMAGAFGYEAEHHEISMQVGEISLFPAIRNALSNVGSENASSVVVAASGASCRPQITDGTGRAAVHPITLIYEDNYS
jgi:Fe-S oxidoreductase